MDKDLEEAKKRLNNFKTIKILYGNTFAMHLEQLEQLQNDIETTLNYIDNSIPKEKVENKIEELNDEEKEIYKKDIGNNELYRLKIIDETRKVLQELLEEE